MKRTFPEEVLEHVFSFLNTQHDRNTVSLVSKSWYEMERWCRKRVFIGNCYAVNPRVLIQKFPEVKSIEMVRVYPLLEEIKLKRMVVSDKCLEMIGKGFKNFRVLSLVSCEGFSTDGLAAIAANCRNLRVLDLRECEVEDLS